ncbi:glycine cleavage system protein GcvH [Geobacter argillaceus]|uniref:Glycine cleavage system H protein n=1 Tax=Geobacter argillaceus TaxID=345631 RepID=A0A562W979_9BACT|nr:glycine cleavage system protein GcvH [Geobacter argillaceus]TWJ26517.1 glycine cleavage system H protein [Geobacter argillaceus]
MDLPEELKYSKEHLWIRVEGDRAIVGITDYAQEELGIVTSVELPSVGDELEQDDSFGSIEARKTVADLYAPVSGTVLEVNSEVADSPGQINDDPYDSGWLIMVEMSDPEELKLLLTADDYAEAVEESE